MNNIGIINYLEIEHPHTGKISSILKCVSKSLIRFDSTGGHYFIGDPGNFRSLEEFGCILGINTPDIIVLLVVVQAIVSCIHYIFIPVFLRMC